MFQVYDVRIIIEAQDADDCPSSDDVTEAIGDLFEHGGELGFNEGTPRFVGVRATSTSRKPREIRMSPKPRKVERPEHCKGCRFLSKARWCSVAHERRRLLSLSCSQWEKPITFRLAKAEVSHAS